MKPIFVWICGILAALVRSEVLSGRGKYPFPIVIMVHDRAHHVASLLSRLERELVDWGWDGADVLVTQSWYGLPRGWKVDVLEETWVGEDWASELWPGRAPLLLSVVEAGGVEDASGEVGVVVLDAVERWKRRGWGGRVGWQVVEIEGYGGKVESTRNLVAGLMSSVVSEGGWVVVVEDDADLGCGALEWLQLPSTEVLFGGREEKEKMPVGVGGRGWVEKVLGLHGLDREVEGVGNGVMVTLAATLRAGLTGGDRDLPPWDLSDVAMRNECARAGMDEPSAWLKRAVPKVEVGSGRVLTRVSDSSRLVFKTWAWSVDRSFARDALNPFLLASTLNQSVASQTRPKFPTTKWARTILEGYTHLCPFCEHACYDHVIEYLLSAWLPSAPNRPASERPVAFAPLLPRVSQLPGRGMTYDHNPTPPVVRGLCLDRPPPATVIRGQTHSTNCPCTPSILQNVSILDALAWTDSWTPTLGSGAVAPHYHRHWLFRRAVAFRLLWLADGALPIIAALFGDHASYGLYGISGWLLWLALCAQEPFIRIGLVITFLLSNAILGYLAFLCLCRGGPRAVGTACPCIPNCIASIAHRLPTPIASPLFSCVRFVRPKRK